MRARDGAQLARLTQSAKCVKLSKVAFVSTAGLGIGDIGEPFELRGYVSKLSVLGRRQRALWYQIGRHPAPVRLFLNAIMSFIELDV